MIIEGRGKGGEVPGTPELPVRAVRWTGCCGLSRAKAGEERQVPKELGKLGNSFGSAITGRDSRDVFGVRSVSGCGPVRSLLAGSGAPKCAQGNRRLERPAWPSSVASIIFRKIGLAVIVDLLTSGVALVRG